MNKLTKFNCHSNGGEWDLESAPSTDDSKFKKVKIGWFSESVCV